MSLILSNSVNVSRKKSPCDFEDKIFNGNQKTVNNFSCLLSSREIKKLRENRPAGSPKTSQFGPTLVCPFIQTSLKAKAGPPLTKSHGYQKVKKSQKFQIFCQNAVKNFPGDYSLKTNLSSYFLYANAIEFLPTNLYNTQRLLKIQLHFVWPRFCRKRSLIFYSSRAHQNLFDKS